MKAASEPSRSTSSRARLRVVDDRLDLAAMADDALVLEQALDVALREARDPVEIEVMEGGAEILALGEDGAPAQARLEALEAQLLEQAPVVVDREAPFGVVIAEKLRRGAAPAASRLAVRADDRRTHVFKASMQKLRAAYRSSMASARDLGAYDGLCDERIVVHPALKIRQRRIVRHDPSARVGLKTAGQQEDPSSKPRLIHSLWPSMNWPAWLLLPENLSSTTNI